MMKCSKAVRLIVVTCLGGFVQICTAHNLASGWGNETAELRITQPGGTEAIAYAAVERPVVLNLILSNLNDAHEHHTETLVSSTFSSDNGEINNKIVNGGTTLSVTPQAARTYTFSGFATVESSNPKQGQRNTNTAPAQLQVLALPVLTASVSAGSSSPNPAFVNELITADVEINTNENQINQGPWQIVGRSYGWMTNKIESWTDAPGSYGYGLSGYDVTFESATAKKTKVKAKFGQPMYYNVILAGSASITVRAPDNSEHVVNAVSTNPPLDASSMVANVGMIAGDWVAVTPDEIVPTTPISQSVDLFEVYDFYITVQETFHAATKTVHRADNWVKAVVWGAGTPSDSPGVHEMNYGPVTVAPDDASRKKTYKWVPGSVSRQKTFAGSVSYEVTAWVEGDVDNIRFWAPHGRGITNAKAEFSLAYNGAGSGAGPNVSSTILIDNTEGEGIQWAVSLPPGIEASQSDDDDWKVPQPGNRTKSGTIPFNLDSGSGGALTEVWLKTNLHADAKMQWFNNAEGPFFAFAEAKVTNFTLTPN